METRPLGEIETDPSHRDFERGDRFYWTTSEGEIKFGTVIYSAESKIEILSDESEIVTFPENPYKSLIASLYGCGKPLDLSQIEEGSVISLTTFGHRDYVEVTNYIPGGFIQGVFLGSTLPIAITADEEATLEQKMAYWELEG